MISINVNERYGMKNVKKATLGQKIFSVTVLLVGLPLLALMLFGIWREVHTTVVRVGLRPDGSAMYADALGNTNGNHFTRLQFVKQ